MSRFTMSSYVRLLKKACVNDNISDEEFVRLLFAPLIEAGNVKDRNGSLLDLDKARVSRLLNQKDDVPAVMKDALLIYNIYEGVEGGFENFISDYLDKNKIPSVLNSIADQIKSDNTLIPETKSSLLEKKNDTTYFIIYSFMEAVKVDNRERSEGNIIWERGDNSVQVICGDIFKFGFGNRSKKEKNIVVIPVNTAFDTKVTTKLEREPHPLVSETTLHGQWLRRWEESGYTIQDLDKRIEEGIKLLNLTACEKVTETNGKPLRYPIGSILPIETDNAVYYLLAISDFNENNNAHSKDSKIKESLLSLLKQYDTAGQGYHLYLPLMGTGRSRANLSHQQSYDLIKEAILGNTHLIQGHITIVVQADVYKKLKI